MSSSPDDISPPDSEFDETGGSGGGNGQDGQSDTRDKDIVPVSIEDEMKSSYLDYAMSVIVSRA
ncbi:MAG: hypothetical protein CMM20_06860, partial [Rhodospirillaceae bacterium]|nr:hypothetical protein [Rhodospirillaceae bacterium]